MQNLVFPTHIFNATDEHPNTLVNPTLSKVHIRIQQRTAKKRITTIEGLQQTLDLKKILKALKKVLSCGGALLSDDKNLQPDGSSALIIKLSGDQRTSAQTFLTTHNLVESNDIVIHGF